MMLQKVKQFIAKHNLCNKNSTILVAVSGGADSMVLAHILKALDYNISIAHCNFKLRGAESDNDAQVVKDFAIKNQIQFYAQNFDTIQYAEANKISIQIAARQLRYQYFDSLICEQTNIKFDFIATAHHINDNVETAFLHFVRGTGIKGLNGIPVKNNNIIRPLLAITRQEIETYANDLQLKYVIDSSNLKSNYTRNFIRNEVLPLIAEKIPNVIANIQHTINLNNEAFLLYQQTIAEKKNNLIVNNGAEILIPINKLKKEKFGHVILYEIIIQYGFSAAQLPEVNKLCDAANSSYINSETHQIIKNRAWLIITPLTTNIAQNIIIADFGNVDFELGNLSVTKGNTTIIDDKHVEQIAAKNIAFPLLLRKVKQGDYFYPLGMQKKKKLNRFFIDQKLSATQKQNVWVLTSNDRIVWVIGYRIDDRFKIANPLGEQLILTIKTK